MPIVPVGLLDVLPLVDTENVFVLSQFWNNKKYREFYLKHHWETVIIDNALYEQADATKFDDMVAMARQMDADRVFVVGPECLNDGVETGRMTLGILSEYESDGYITDTIQMMMILHERPNEMLEQWNMIKKHKDVALGISIFSYRLGYDRGSLAKFLNLTGERYLHAFGWDNLLEVYNMRGYFNSVDSSICVSAAINNVDLKKTWQITRNPKMDGMAITERLPIDWENNGSVGKARMDALKLRVAQNIRFLDQHCALEGPIYQEAELRPTEE